MLKRFKKTSPIETYSISSYLDGHLFGYGRIGAGKSVSIKAIVEGFKEMGYKIFDVYGGERNEGLYWTIPSQETSYWQRLGLIGKFDEDGPKQYKVNLLYPYFGSKLPKKLPFKKGIVNSKLFTIPLKEVSIEDIMMIIGIPSESSKYCWQELQHQLTKRDNAGSLLDIASEIKGIKNTPLMKNFIIPMSREHFTMDSYCPYNIDMIDEMKDRDTVSVLCLDFVPKEFHLFVINFLLRTTAELIDSNKIGRKNICFIREAATFFRATDDSVVEDRFKIFRSQLAMYLRMGRRGMFFCLDCQSASETKGLVSGSEDFLLMFKTTSWRDKEEMCAELRKERRMTSMQISDLAFLERGQCFLAETGRNVKKVQIILPRSWFWKKESGNFYKNVWERLGGEWKNPGEEKDRINELCKNKPPKKEKPILPDPIFEETGTPLASTASSTSLVPPDEENLDINRQMEKEIQIANISKKKPKEALEEKRKYVDSLL